MRKQNYVVIVFYIDYIPMKFVIESKIVKSFRESFVLCIQVYGYIDVVALTIQVLDNYAKNLANSYGDSRSPVTTWYCR